MYDRKVNRFRSRWRGVDGERLVGEVGRESFESFALEEEKVPKFEDDFALRSRDPPDADMVLPLLAILERSFPGGGGISSPG